MVVFVMMASCVWAVADKEINSGNQVWQTIFQGQEYEVLPVERSFVPKVKICGGVDKREGLLGIIMTVIHFDAIGKHSPNVKLQYFSRAIEWDQVIKRAEWAKGEALNDDEVKRLLRVFERQAKKHTPSIPYLREGSTMFAGQAEAMKSSVFGWRFDIPDAIQNLEEKNGWKMDLERFEGLPYDQFMRALNKHALPVLISKKNRLGADQALLALGACSNSSGYFVVCASPVDCGLGRMSFYEKVTQYGPEWGEALSAPGALHWIGYQQHKGEMRPEEMTVKLQEPLPKGCSVIPYKPAEWEVLVAKDIRPSWGALQAEIERIACTNDCVTNEVTSAKEGSLSADGNLWRKYFRSHDTFAVTNDWDLVPQVRLCAAGERVTPFEAAFVTVAVRTHPQEINMVQSGYEWRSVVQFTCEERLRVMSEQEKKVMMEKFSPMGARREPMTMGTGYASGRRLWSLDAEGEKELRTIFAEATNGVVLGPITPTEGKTIYQQAVERLKPFDADEPVKTVMRRVADRYGWEAKVEQVDNPSFAVLKKAVEMEIPGLVKMSGKDWWGVVVGFLVEGGEQYALVANPEEVKPDPRGAEVSQAEHEGRMSLRADLPGRIKYVKLFAKSKFVVDRLLDTNRELPEGCHFVKMSSKPFTIAYFIHDWKPTICSKEKVAELVARTKPVDGPDYKK